MFFPKSPTNDMALEADNKKYIVVSLENLNG